MEMPDGPDLDRLVSRLLNGANDQGHPYSKSDIAEKRLVFRLSRELGFVVQIEEAEGLWYCRLRRRDEVVSSGSGASRPCAVARAAANLHPSLLGAAPAGAAKKRKLAIQGGTLPAVDCEACGQPMLRPTSHGAKICPPCSYRRIRSMKPTRKRITAAGRRAALASGSTSP